MLWLGSLSLNSTSPRTAFCSQSKNVGRWFSQPGLHFILRHIDQPGNVWVEHHQLRYSPVGGSPASWLTGSGGPPSVTDQHRRPPGVCSLPTHLLSVHNCLLLSGPLSWSSELTSLLLDWFQNQSNSPILSSGGTPVSLPPLPSSLKLCLLWVSFDSQEPHFLTKVFGFSSVF